MSLFNKATRFLRRNPVSQVALLVAFWLAGEAFVRLADLPVPGGIIGLAALLLLLMTRRLSAISMRRGADWLLADMLLFFVPAVLAILDHREFFWDDRPEDTVCHRSEHHGSDVLSPDGANRSRSPPVRFVH